MNEGSKRMKENYFVLLLAGSGSRLYQDIHVKKQFFPLGGKSMYLHPLKSAVDSGIFQRIVLVVDKEDEEKVLCETEKEFPGHTFEICYGGKDRNGSVFHALLALKKKAKEDSDVFIHDSDRVLLTKEFIQKLSNQMDGYDAITPALTLHDSILKEEKGNIDYLNRDGLFLVQTPQVFSYSKILNIYESGYNPKDTDDFRKAVSKGLKVRVVPGRYENFKITTMDELALVERLFQEKTPKNE